MQTIPQTCPHANYLSHKEEIDAAIARVLGAGHYILGPEVTRFEEAFAAYVGVDCAIGVASGTDALCLALRASGVGAGDLVFTVSHTAVATVAAIELCGATPVFVDIDPATFTLQPESLEAALARPPAGRPRAVVPVHLYGHPADMPAITETAQRYGLIVVEDCAQAHGAAINGRKVGTWGHAGAFSFYPTKNLGALGDGGMVVTDDDGVADRVRLLRQYGWKERYVSTVSGLNSRLDELQAAILRVKLRHLDAENERRRQIAAMYTRSLEASGLELPETRPGAEHVYHQYVIKSSARDGLRAYLEAHGVGTLIHYPMPIHLQPAYADRAVAGTPLVHTEACAPTILSLPMYPELAEAQVEYIIGYILDWASSVRRREMVV